MVVKINRLIIFYVRLWVIGSPKGRGDDGGLLTAGGRGREDLGKANGQEIETDEYHQNINREVAACPPPLWGFRLPTS